MNTTGRFSKAPAITNLSIQLSGLVDHQTEMKSVMKQMVSVLSASKDGDSNVGDKHLRNIDVQLKTLTDETIKSQDKFADTVHSEIRLLARTISAAMDGSAASAMPTKQRVKTTVTSETTRPTTPKASELKESAAEGDYKMPEIKPKADKKPALTAKRED